MTGQAVRYLLVGVSNTAITLVAYALLVAAGVPAVAASAAAFLAGAANGYRLNRTWTFRSDRRGADRQKQDDKHESLVHRYSISLHFQPHGKKRSPE